MLKDSFILGTRTRQRDPVLLLLFYHRILSILYFFLPMGHESYTYLFLVEVCEVSVLLLHCPCPSLPSATSSVEGPSALHISLRSFLGPPAIGKFLNKLPELFPGTGFPTCKGLRTDKIQGWMGGGKMVAKFLAMIQSPSKVVQWIAQCHWNLRM